MDFFFGLLLFVAGSGLVALCLVALPGPSRAVSAAGGHGHGHASH